MNSEALRDRDPCVIPGLPPYLKELPQPVSIQVHATGKPRREAVEGFIRQAFSRHYGARLNSLYPTLLSFHGEGGLRAALGCRAADQGPLFAEQYLDAPAEQLVESHWNQPTRREQLVEVGNLALANPGEARWVIAAVTTYLHACGYRWVLFTAVLPLINAFQRLGLRPVPLVTADPARLPDGGRDWGSYYRQQPQVCIGDIQAGQRKLSRMVNTNSRPMLYALLDEALRQASPADQREVVR